LASPIRHNSATHGSAAGSRFHINPLLNINHHTTAHVSLGIVGTVMACALAADNEKRLVKKCRELNTEIVSNAAKVQTALKLSEEDQQTILALKKEIEKAWKMVDASHEKASISAAQLDTQSLPKGETISSCQLPALAPTLSKHR
jgi:hypothetical protein